MPTHACRIARKAAGWPAKAPLRQRHGAIRRRRQRHFATGDNFLRRPLAAAAHRVHSQPGVAFLAGWAYAAERCAFTESSGDLLLPHFPHPYLRPTLNNYDSFRKMAQMRLPPSVTPSAPVATAEYSVALTGTESGSLDFKMPLISVKSTNPEFAAVQQFSLDDFSLHQLDADR